MSEKAITVKNLSKVYHLSHERQKMRGTATFRDALYGIAKKPMQLLTGRRLQKEDFWALEDIGFEIERGDVVGIIGRNGSGKSTLLKILSQIVEPTKGEIHMKGKVASLLEVGTGFHPELTGRENIFFNGAILGMKRREIINKFDEIVAFSEIEQFLDTPVKYYSSGMYVRLAFSVAAHLDPDILIVDEVLAVGDAAFQKKSIGKMKSVAESGRTVLFVSHNMDSVSSLCNKALLLDQGSVLKYGETNKVIARYISSSREARSSFTFPVDKTKVAQIKELRMLDEKDNETTSIVLGNKWSIKITYEVRKELRNTLLALEVLSTTGEILYFSSDNDSRGELMTKAPGKYKAVVSPHEDLLSPGDYRIRLSIQSPNIEVYDYVEDIPILVLPPHDDIRATYYNGRYLGHIGLASQWYTEAFKK